MKKLIVLAGLMVFSVFAFTRMEASDMVDMQSTIDEQEAKIAELESELECYEAISLDGMP